jgi:integrase
MPKKAKYHRRTDGLLETTRTDPRTGKRIHFYGHTDREIDAQILEYSAARERGRLFSEVAEEWRDQHFPTLAHNTLRGYRPAYERAVEHFGSEPIRKIRPQDVKAFIHEFARGGRAKKTVTTQLQMVSMICAYGVESGDLDFSPCDHISVPKNLPKQHRDAASPEDEAKVKQSAEVWLLPYLILYTGLRKGEALALTQDDFDFKAKTIHVCKSVYHDGNAPKIKTPKTQAGTRTVPILDPLLKKLPRRWSGYLFSTDGGKTPLTEMQYQKLWREYAQSTGITATAHQLRHSFATMLYECGIEVKDAQDLLGHSTAAMTQDIYTHLRDTRKAETAKTLNQKLKERESK